MHLKLSSLILAILMLLPECKAQYEEWKHSGSLYIVTTPEGADLPAGAIEHDFPLLVRLDKDFFDFGQALGTGADIRFSEGGSPLAYQIEQWNPQEGTAHIWVRIPIIKGNEQQLIKMHWGNANVASDGNSESVFRVEDGFAGVWHLNDNLEDATSNNLDGFNKRDKPTTNSRGIIGDAQDFGANKLLVIRPPGIAADRRVTCMPSGNADRTMSAWVKPTSFEGLNWASASIGGWGEPNRGIKPNMGLSYMTMTGIGQPRFHLYGFDPRCENELSSGEWRHIALSVSDDMVRFYVDGVLKNTIDNSGALVNKLGTLNTPESTPVDLGDHGNGRGPFNGTLDEVRFESTARSENWMRLCFENQKPLQTLVGPLMQQDNTFSVSHSAVEMAEGEVVELSAIAGGARKLYWVLKDGNTEQILAVDRFHYQFNSGRVDDSKKINLEVRALYASGMKTKTIRIDIQENLPNPVFTLNAPKTWNGRDELIISPSVSNAADAISSGNDGLNYSWTVSGMATISETKAGQLLLKRAQNSGVLTVGLSLDNGGTVINNSIKIKVSEPKKDGWITRNPLDNEHPADHQFYARNDSNVGRLHYRGTLTDRADSAFLKLYLGDKLIDTQRQNVTGNNKYTLSSTLKAGLVVYRTEFGVTRDGTDTVLHTANDLVCGDVYIIQGQSNAEAWTDQRVIHPYQSHWLRSFGTPTTNKDRARDVVWGNALSFNGGDNHHHLQVGYWGIELGKMLIKQHSLPICIINGAQGGTRIDQHQRNESDPTDVSTIYGRLLWRLQQARLTHGVRAVLWHQGENDQGAAGATGTFGWVNYQDYFISMTAAWKQDFPNINHFYIHQIWPGACGARSIENDRLREVQRRLPEQFSNMSLMSTLGIRPGGGCHYLPEGYVAMARQLFPLVNKHNYSVDSKVSLTPPNIQSVAYTTERKDEIRLTFDQEVKWDGEIAGRFYLDGKDARLTTDSGAGKVLILKMAEPSTAKTLSYIKGDKWRQADAIVWGRNNLAALTFCEVPIQPASPR